MRKLVVYSSMTGNTFKVAMAINEVVKGDISSVENAPDLSLYDLVILGFYVDKGEPDVESLKFFSKLNRKNIAIFFTMGADPSSEHAEKVIKKANGFLENNSILGYFCCQGRVDARLVEKAKRLPMDHHNAMTPERLARIEKASVHPNSNDLVNAKKFAQEIVSQANDII